MQVVGRERAQVRQGPVYQMVGVQREQHAATDADAAVDQRDASGGQRAGQGLLEGLAALGFSLPFFNLFIEFGCQLQLEPDDPHQNEYEGAQQHRHQVAEDRPGRRRGVQAGIELVVHVA